LKPGSINPPDDYLGIKIRSTTLPNGQTEWGRNGDKVALNTYNVQYGVSKNGDEKGYKCC
jgi:hypothetical protein